MGGAPEAAAARGGGAGRGLQGVWHSGPSFRQGPDAASGATASGSSITQQLQAGLPGFAARHGQAGRAAHQYSMPRYREPCSSSTGTAPVCTHRGQAGPDRGRMECRAWESVSQCGPQLRVQQPSIQPAIHPSTQPARFGSACPASPPTSGKGAARGCWQHIRLGPGEAPIGGACHTDGIADLISVQAQHVDSACSSSSGGGGGGSGSVAAMSQRPGSVKSDCG